MNLIKDETAVYGSIFFAGWLLLSIQLNYYKIYKNSNEANYLTPNDEVNNNQE